MNLIIIEDKGFLVNKIELLKLRSMQLQIKLAEYPENSELEEKLNLYLDEAKKNYREIGYVEFDCRR